MLIISQNTTNYNLRLSENCVFRINLDLCIVLMNLKILFQKQYNHNIFLDLPSGRIKLSDNRYSLKEITLKI